MKRAFCYLVLGLGGIGSAAAYWLARQAGRGVWGIEHYSLDHVRGGSQGHSRIIPLSYHNLYYVNLTKEADCVWTAVSQRTDTFLRQYLPWLLGKILSQITIAGKSEFDLTSFQISRPIPFAKNSVRGFMV